MQKKKELSGDQWQVVQKLEQNHGAPIDLTSEEKAIFDAFTLLHPFFDSTEDLQEKWLCAVKPSNDLFLVDKQRWPILGYFSALLSEKLLRSFFPFKQQRANPIAHS